MIYYVLDSGVLINRYKRPEDIPARNRRYFDNTIECYGYIKSQWVMGAAILIVPNFTISEIFNFFAFHYFRRENAGNSSRANGNYLTFVKNLIEKIQYTPLESLKQRHELNKMYLNYELNRHHILELDKIMPVEHTTEPLVKPNGKISALGGIDLLVIAVAIELETFLGEGNVYIATIEKRMAKVCANSSFPKCYNLGDITDPPNQLPSIQCEQTVNIPEPVITL